MLELSKNFWHFNISISVWNPISGILQVRASLVVSGQSSLLCKDSIHVYERTNLQDFTVRDSEIIAFWNATSSSVVEIYWLWQHVFFSIFKGKAYSGICSCLHCHAVAETSITPKGFRYENEGEYQEVVVKMENTALNKYAGIFKDVIIYVIVLKSKV